MVNLDVSKVNQAHHEQLEMLGLYYRHVPDIPPPQALVVANLELGVAGRFDAQVLESSKDIMLERYDKGAPSMGDAYRQLLLPTRLADLVFKGRFSKDLHLHMQRQHAFDVWHTSITHDEVQAWEFSQEKDPWQTEVGGNREAG